MADVLRGMLAATVVALVVLIVAAQSDAAEIAYDVHGAAPMVSVAR